MSQSPQEPRSNDASPQQDAKGRFVAGNSGGLGNPFARQVAQMRKLIVEALDETELRAIARSLIERATGGDVAAARLLFQYAMGKPAKAAEPDRVDIDEFRLREESTIPPGQWVPTLGQLSVETVNGLVDNLKPILEADTRKTFAEFLRSDDSTPAGRRAGRKAKKRLFRALNLPMPPSANGSDGGGSKLRFDKHGFPLDMGFGPDRAG
jgi:hypothetical protein